MYIRIVEYKPETIEFLINSRNFLTGIDFATPEIFTKYVENGYNAAKAIKGGIIISVDSDIVRFEENALPPDSKPQVQVIQEVSDEVKFDIQLGMDLKKYRFDFEKEDGKQGLELRALDALVKCLQAYRVSDTQSSIGDGIKYEPAIDEAGREELQALIMKKARKL